MLYGCATTVANGPGPDVNPSLTIYGSNSSTIFKEAGEQCPNGYNIITNIFLEEEVYHAFVRTINQALQIRKDEEEITVQYIIRALEKQTGKDAMELINLI